VSEKHNANCICVGCESAKDRRIAELERELRHRRGTEKGIMKSMRSAHNCSRQVAEIPANIEAGAGGVIEIKYTTPPEPVETTVKREDF